MQKCFIFLFAINLVCATIINAQVKTNTQKSLSGDTTLNINSKANLVQPVQTDSLNNSYKDSLKSIQKKFENFEYGEVIKEANKLLINRNQMLTSDLFEVLRMKGISHFSLSEDEPAKNSFLEILKIDTSYVLDSLKTSPKIISFFNNVKKTYLGQLSNKTAQEVLRIDTVYVTDPLKVQQIENSLKTSAMLSIIYPGVGHLYDGQKTKGWVLTSLTTIAVASSAYFYFDANKKKTRYLDEKNPAYFDSRYSDYNKSYKFRNYSIIALGVVWLYSQLDLLFFSNSRNVKNVIAEKSSFKFDPINGLRLDFGLSF
jgi:hypothetical protein